MSINTFTLALGYAVVTGSISVGLAYADGYKISPGRPPRYSRTYSRLIRDSIDNFTFLIWGSRILAWLRGREYFHLLDTVISLWALLAVRAIPKINSLGR